MLFKCMSSSNIALEIESRNADFPETLGINHFLIWGGGICCEKFSLIFAITTTTTTTTTTNCGKEKESSHCSRKKICKKILFIEYVYSSNRDKIIV